MRNEFDTMSNETSYPFESEIQNSAESIPVYAIFQLFLFTTIFIIGFFGNCIVIYGVLQQGSAKTTSSCFIANLALSDLAVLVLSLPVSLLQELASWPFGELACKIFFPLGDVFVAVSIMTLTAIALDRYRAIVTPFKDRFSKKQAKICLSLIWILCYLTVGLPTTFLLKLVVTETGEKICYPFWNNATERRIHMVLIATLVTLPLFLIGFCYIRVVLALWKVQIIHRETTKNSIAMMRLEQKRKLVKMLIVIVVAFSACLLPYIVYALFLEFAEKERSSSDNIGLVTVLSLLFANSAINPIILCSMSKDYRKGLRPCGC